MGALRKRLSGVSGVDAKEMASFHRELTEFFTVYIFFILIVDYIGSFIINTSIETSTQEIDYLTKLIGRNHNT